MGPIWQKNLLALQQEAPALAQSLLSDFQVTELYRTGSAQDGSPLVGIKMENGQYAALGHSLSPARDAQNWVKSLGSDVLNYGNVLLLGTCSGYHPLALFQEISSETHLWINEPDKNLFRVILQILDLSALIRSKRVHFLVGLDVQETVKYLFSGSESFRVISQGLRLVHPPLSQHLYGEYVRNLAKAIQESFHFECLKFNTTELQGETILKNILANLPLVIQSAPVLSLLSKAAGIPALLIGPGPSLEEAIPSIRKMQDSSMVIAIDTAHRILLRHGIQADIVVSLDFTELNSKHFEGFDPDEAFLVAFPGIDPRIPQKYLGRTFFYNHSGNINYTPGATQFFDTLESLGPLGTIISYGSTAHSAYHLARLMGCSPIVLIGNDLAFPSEKRYARGAMQNDLKPDANMEELILDVLSNDGNPVKTIALYKIYLDAFGELIEGTGGVAMNVSIHGAKIAHCPYMPIEKVMAGFPSAKVDKSFLRIRSQQNFLDKKVDILDEMDTLVESCRRARKKLQRLINDYETINPAEPGYPTKMLQFWKSFVVLMSEEERAMRISTALCSRSSVTLMGNMGNSGFLRGQSPEQSKEAYSQGEIFFKGFPPGA